MTNIKLIYEQVKEQIKKDAEKKQPGEFLISEVQYSTTFGVSRPTIRKAVDELIEEGLIRRIPGKGLIIANTEEEKNGKRGIIAICVPYAPDDGFFYKLAYGCVDVLNSVGFEYKILKYGSREEKSQTREEILIGGVSGVITVAHYEEDAEFIKKLDALNIPCILTDNPIEGVGMAYVVTDDFRGGYLTAQYLLQYGHKDILYIAIGGSIHTVEKRLEGFKKAFADSGHEYNDDNILTLDKDEAVYSLLDEVKTNYTAICGYSDLPVIMAYNTLVGKGVKIPDEVSLMGYGNFKASELLGTPLTTIEMPVYEMGREAAVMLVEYLMEGKIPVNKVLEVALVERRSVASITL